MAAEVTAFDAGLAPVAIPARRDRWAVAAAAAGGLFVLALVAGFVLAPSAPPPLASRLRVHEYFVANHDAALHQSFLVHGVAGVALVVLVLAVWRAFLADGTGRVARRVFVGCGLAAAAASFVQLYFVLRIENHIERGIGVRRTDVLFDGLNRACALKLALLAVAVVTASSLVPRHVRWIGYVATPLLGFAALTMVTTLPGAHALLFFAHA